METADLEQDTATKCCLICTVPIHFSRLGVHACRACAAFYKRAKTTGKVLVCRRGDYKCVFRKNEKFMCKKCRFDKCVELGMEYTPEEKGKETTPDENEPSTSKGQPQTLLEKIRIAYGDCCARRRTHELELAKQHNLERVPHTSEAVYLLIFQSAVAASKASAPEYWTFFQEAFPSLKALPDEHQRDLFNLCIARFMTVDSASRTKQIWGCIDRYMLSTLILCSDSENLEVLAGPHEEGPLRDALMAVTKTYVQDLKSTVFTAFDKADLHETEILALFPLLLSETEICSAEQCHPLLDAIRHEVLDDLHQFYTKQLGIREYSTRLGSLLSLCNSIREADMIFQKFFRMQVTIFDLYKTENMLQDLFL